MGSPAAIESLRAQIRRIESGHRANGPVLPFGIGQIDGLLPGGGLARAAVHEIGGAGAAADGAAAALFAAGVAARVPGQVLWCVTRPDLFAPGLAQAGLQPARLVMVEAQDEAALLACCEEGLRHAGLGTVVAETTRFSMTASRRLQLAAEAGGVLGLVLRGKHSSESTACATSWRIAALPSVPLPVPGVGRARWQVELLRCRGGMGGVFEMEACDGQGRLSVSAELAYGSDAARFARGGAAA